MFTIRTPQTETGFMIKIYKENAMPQNAEGNRKFTSLLALFLHMCEVQPYRYVIIQKIWNAFICDSCTLRLWSQVLYTIKAQTESQTGKR